MYEGGGQSQMNINLDNSMILQKQVVGLNDILYITFIIHIVRSWYQRWQYFSFLGKHDKLI